MREGLLGRMIIGVAKRLLPSDFKGSLELTLPSGQVIILGGQNPGEKADLKLRNFKVVWAGIRRAQLGFLKVIWLVILKAVTPPHFFGFICKTALASMKLRALCFLLA